MIQIDGAYRESGGQIIRTALALSTILQKPFEIRNIRAARPQPGLKAQHFYSVKALQKLCNADVEGLEIGSTHLKYHPGKIKVQSLDIDIGTAGSITLLLQSLLLPCLFADTKIKLEIKGGTDVKWSMPFDYFNNVFIPHVKKFVKKIEVKLERRGYYPKGGGKVSVNIEPEYKPGSHHDTQLQFARINLMERAYLVKIDGISHASRSLEGAKVAERQADSAEIILRQLNSPVSIMREYSDTLSAGSVVTLWATFSKKMDDLSEPVVLGADSLGEPKKRSEEPGEDAAQTLINEIKSGAPVDEHLADNLIPYLALFSGEMKVSRLSNHTITNIYVCEQFLGKIFKVNKEEGIIRVISNHFNN